MQRWMQRAIYEAMEEEVTGLRYSVRKKWDVQSPAFDAPSFNHMPCTTGCEKCLAYQRAYLRNDNIFNWARKYRFSPQRYSDGNQLARAASIVEKSDEGHINVEKIGTFDNSAVSLENPLPIFLRLMSDIKRSAESTVHEFTVCSVKVPHARRWGFRTPKIFRNTRLYTHR